MKTWQELARAIPLFDGAKLTNGDRVTACGATYLHTTGSWSSTESTAERIERHVVDLTDRQTANEVLCRLALHLGAPPELVDAGVMFTWHGGCRKWLLGAGAYQYGRVWQSLILTGSITDRPTAIATAWAEAHKDPPVDK